MNINPPQVKLTAWDTQRFRVEEGGTVVTPTDWRIEPLGRGKLADGIYTSPKWIFLSRSAMVVATAKNSQGQDETVSAAVELSNVRTWIVFLSTFLFLMGSGILYALYLVWPKASSPGGSASIFILIIAGLFGALGGLLHAVNSLVSFVGSGKFVSSWSLFYLARPFVGAIMALLVFLVFKGKLAADTLQATDLFGVAAVAGLVGMFSDRAAEKLKEIFEVALGPKADARANKLQEGNSTRPTIVDVNPKIVPKGTTPPLVLTGSGLVNRCKGQVNGKDRPTTFQSASQVTITPEPADVAAAGTLVLTIVNPTGETTNVYSVAVA